MSDTITVGIELTVTVDRDRWERVYGDVGTAAIRESVKRYALHAIGESAATDEAAIIAVARRAGR